MSGPPVRRQRQASGWLAALAARWRSIWHDPGDDPPISLAQAVDTGLRQPGVGRDFTRWTYPGHCPDCGAKALHAGPRGGGAVNCRCTNCGQWWNAVWPMPGRNNLALIERIDK